MGKKKRKEAQTPYQKNDIMTVAIEDIGQSGEGIGKVNGYTLFVKEAVIGDVVKVSVMKAKKNYAYARLLRVEKPSPFRVEPRCPICRQCGGCQIQALCYDKQLEYKENKVRNDLIRIGGFPKEEIQRVMRPIVGMEEPYRYRNKAQVPLGERGGEPVAGFYAGHTHSIVPMTDCGLGAKENAPVIEAVLSYMKQYHVPAYREETGEGVLRHVLIRKGFHSGQLMVCLIANAESLPHEAELIRMLCGIPGMASISLNTNWERTNVILGKKLRTLWGSEGIEDSLQVYECDSEWKETGRAVRFQISPLSFYQVNPRQTERLYSIALSYAALTGNEVVWDLYCGIGTISLFLAGNAKEVYGVEVVPEAIEDARANARLNGIENVAFEVGKAEEVLPAYCARRREAGDVSSVDVVVVDPPRKGCDPVCLETILAAQPKRIVYVSCDPATLARDLRILADGGYELQAVQPVDQFGQTVHIETVVRLQRKHT